jgi:hypothetical protein
MGVPSPPPLKHESISPRLAPPTSINTSPAFLTMDPKQFQREKLTSRASLGGLGHPPAFFIVASPMPNPQSDLVSHVPSPQILDPGSENQIVSFPTVELPVEDEGDDFLPRAPGSFVGSDTMLKLKEDAAVYKSNAQKQMTSPIVNASSEKGYIGFVDGRGYLIELGDIPDGRDDILESEKVGSPAAQGEATLFTATAVIALATGNYKPDTWGLQNANAAILQFLDVLQNRSWANTDFLSVGQISQGEEHPIRHPDWLEFDEKHRSRPRPMSKDAFGAIIAACYYAYNCPNSTENVRTQSQRLLNRWITYLVEHKWTIHTNWAKDEFERTTYGDVDLKNPIHHLGVEAFILLPHEIHALKNCAISLSVQHTIIFPPLDAGVALDNAMLVIAKGLRRALDHVLDFFTYSTTYDVELIPGWRRSTIKGRFTVNIIGPLKTRILDAFQAACELIFSESTSTFRDPHALSHGFDTLVAGAIDRIAGLFPDALDRFHLGSVLLDLLKQLLPWFDPEVLAEFVAFTTFLGPASGAKDSDIDYAVWSFAIELECRPALVLWLRPEIATIWTAIAHRGNTNGVWAWLAGEQSTIDAQIATFEANELNHWKYYAYTKNYQNWLSNDVNVHPERHGPAASRLDYLLLLGLTKKGRPKLAPDVKLDLKLLWEGFKQCIQALIDKAISDFKALGKYERVFIDLTGATIQEIIHQIDGFTRNVWRAGSQTSKFVHHLAGWVEHTGWDATGFSHYTKWAKALPDLALDPTDLIEHQLRNGLDASKKVWQWTNGALTHFTKWTNTNFAGAITDPEDFIITQFRLPDLRLQQWIKVSHVLISFTVWSTSSTHGVIEAEKLILHQLRDPTGSLRQWKFVADRGLQSFTHWLDSKSDMSTEAAKVASVR